MIRRVLVAAAALMVPLVALTPAAVARSRLCPMNDLRLAEVSGTAARAADPRYVYLQNDSGDSALRIRLPGEPQGEGGAVVGGALWLSSEARDQPILPVPLPRAVRRAPTTAPSHSSPAPSSPSPTPGHGSSDTGIGWGLIAIMAAAVIAFLLGSRLRQRGRRKDAGGEDLSWTG
jgi:hypothetical protein